MAVMAIIDYAAWRGLPTAVADLHGATGPESASAELGRCRVTDADDFRIGSNSGVLTFRAAPDFDAPTDANMDNVYMVTVMADDGTYDGHERSVTVTVTDVDDSTVTPMPGDGDELDRLIDRYQDDNGAIELEEVVAAINDYLFGPWESEGFTEDGLFDLIDFFLFG